MISFNPSITLICAFLYSIFISFNTVELIYVLPILYLVFCHRDSFVSIIKKLMFLNLFILMIFVVLLIESSFEEALNVYIRTNMIILFNLLLFSHSNGYDIVRGLNELRFPKKLVSSVYFTLKMIQTLSDEFKNIKMTLRARGFRANSSMFAYETYGNLFGHIFVKSIKKAAALQDSFKLRGFKGRIYLINNSKFKFYDFILLFLVCMLFVQKVIV